jgi:hypothetical protein
VADPSISPAVADPSIRIGIADDNALVRSGLAVILNSEAGLEVVGDAADGPTAARGRVLSGGRRAHGH